MHVIFLEVIYENIADYSDFSCVCECVCANSSIMTDQCLSVTCSDFSSSEYVYESSVRFLGVFRKSRTAYMTQGCAESDKSFRYLMALIIFF
jgi:hypothetical protein